MVAPPHSIIDREGMKVFLLATIRKYGRFARDSAYPYDRLVTVKRQKGNYASFLVLPNILQNIFSKRIV